MNTGFIARILRHALIVPLLLGLMPVMHASAQSDTIRSLPPRIDLSTVGSKTAEHIAIEPIMLDKAAEDEMRKRTYQRINIYDTPYSKTSHYPNYRRLWLNTGVLCGAGVVALGVLESLPDNTTNWNRDELREVPWIQRWGNHVKKVAHWDGDSPIFNYILHPYGGAAYYMSARSQGFNMKWSAVYCFCISTFFWEYGVEAFMEIPSIQDLVITPVAGTLLGECFYKLKRRIVADGYTLCGSAFLGNFVAYLIDPVNEVIGLFAGNPCRQGIKARRNRPEVAFMPSVASSRSGVNYGFTLNVAF